MILSTKNQKCKKKQENSKGKKTQKQKERKNDSKNCQKKQENTKANEVERKTKRRIVKTTVDSHYNSLCRAYTTATIGCMGSTHS